MLRKAMTFGELAVLDRVVDSVEQSLKYLFDQKTLDLLDTDKDGRIRVPGFQCCCLVERGGWHRRYTVARSDEVVTL